MAVTWSSSLENMENAEVVREFIAEARDFVETLQHQLLALENALNQGTDYLEPVHAIFRGFHSLKGAADYLKFRLITALTHETESLLDSLRKERRPLLRAHVEILFNCSSQLEGHLDELESNSNNPALERSTEELLVQLKQLNRSGSATPGAVQPDEVSQTQLVSLAHQIIDWFKHSEGNPKALFENLNLLASLSRCLEGASYPAWAMAMRKLHCLLNSLAKHDGKVSEALHGLLETIVVSYFESVLHGAALPELSAELQTQLDQLLLVEWEHVSKDGSSPMLGETLVSLGIVSEEQLARALKLQTSPLGAILKEFGNVSDNDLNLALNLQNSRKLKDDSVQYRVNTIRVNIEKLDSLCNLIEDLVITETLLTHEWQHGEMGIDNLPTSSRKLNRISRDLQAIARQFRMVPLEASFQKLSRLARDLAGKLEKKVRVDITGGETEIDKNVVELLAQPLAHMVRNALDHGLESTAERIKAGKPEIGVLSLHASHEGSNVIVRISEDGAGLNVEKILAKAREKHLVPPAFHPKSPAEVHELIWIPGFSTAATVTEVSGRGVGMDVVKKEIEHMHGSVAIDSEPNHGTSFTLTIPLSLSIIEGMLVRVNHHVFTLPLTNTRQTFVRESISEIHPPDGSTHIKVRGQMMPLISLGDYFDDCTGEAPILVVLVNNDQYCCLGIDEVLGMRRTVVQNVPAYLGKLRGISGFSVLGDGGITYVLDASNIWDTFLSNSGVEELGP